MGKPRTETTKTETTEQTPNGNPMHLIFGEPRFVVLDSGREFTNNEGKKNETTELPVASVILPYRNADTIGAAGRIYAHKPKGKPAVLVFKFAGSRAGSSVIGLDLGSKAHVDTYKLWLAQQYADKLKENGNMPAKQAKATTGVAVEGLDNLFTS